MGNAYFTIDEGVDKNIATYSRTVDGATVHSQKMVVDEPGMATYNIVVLSAGNITAADRHLLQIMAGGTNRVYLRRLTMWQVANATTQAVIQIVLQRLTTAGTGGTSLTPAPFDPAASASGATAMTIPTSKGTEGTVLDQWRPLIHTAVTDDDYPRPILDWSWDDPRVQPPTIAAGTSNGLAVKCTSSDATAQFVTMALISEASY